jgi:hypothetical protein
MRKKITTFLATPKRKRKGVQTGYKKKYKGQGR